jgi:mRNA degradation ribonuclease J1/J2
LGIILTHAHEDHLKQLLITQRKKNIKLWDIKNFR